MDKIKDGTKAWSTRQAVWRHNSFYGHAKLIQANCNSIMQAETTTDEARVLAREINDLAIQLSAALKERRQ